MKKNTLDILMREYLGEAIKEHSKEIIDTTVSSVQKGLFTIDGKMETYVKTKGEMFHSITDKLIYV